MATSAPSSSSSNKEKTNHIRLCRFLVDIGRQVLQDVFDRIYPPATLNVKLWSTSNRKILRNLQTRKVIFGKQWDTLFPTSGAVTSADFDITLLFVLLRNICRLTAPGTGWDNPPLVSDLSNEADLVRIKIYRNELYAHIVNAAIPDNQFQTLWDDIEAALIRLGGSKHQEQIHRCKHDVLDPDCEDRLKVVLQSWTEGEKKTVDVIREESAEIVGAIRELHEQIDQHEGMIAINGRVRLLTAGGHFVAWAAGSAYFLYRFRDDPETVIELVQKAIIPSFVIGAVVHRLLPGSFKILVKIRTLDALDAIWKSYIEGDMKKKLEEVVVTDDLRSLAPDDVKNVDILLEFSKEEYIKTRDYLSESALRNYVKDFEKTQQKCTVRAIDGKTLRVEQVDVCECIEVSGLGSSTTHDTIFYYFENPRKSGGGDVEKVEYVKGETKALVFFKDPSVIDSVVDREHLINGATVKAIPSYPFLCETPIKLEEKQEEKLLKVDLQTMEVIEKLFHQEFQDLLEEKQVQYTFLQSSGEVVLRTVNSSANQANFNDVETYINRFTQNKVEVSRQLWKELEDDFMKQCTPFTDRMDLTYLGAINSSVVSITISGKVTDVEAVTEILNHLIEKGTRIEEEKKEIPKEIPLTKAQFELINLVGFANRLQAHCVLETFTNQKITRGVAVSSAAAEGTIEQSKQRFSNPPKKNTPTSAEAPVTEEKSRTVEIIGISPKTIKDTLLNFFENKRRSGGGEIENIQYKQDEGLAEITFCSSEDAENISQKEGLQLDGAKIGLALKELPKVLPKDPCKLHVMGLSEKITKDGFLSFIEVVSGEEVENMLFGSNSNVMVTFEDPPDLEKIQQKCRNRPLDGNHLQVEQVSICDCIEVSGLGSKTTRDTIMYYFENPRKSGGGDVKKVEYVDGETKALVFFEEPSDVDRVVTHEHVMYAGEPLKVVPHYPFLGEPSKEPGGGKREKQLNADPQAIAFIENFFQKEFEELLQGNEVKLNQEQGKDEAVLVAINNKIDKAKWYESCAVIEKYINEITSQEVLVSSAAWKETIQLARAIFSTAEDKIDILCKEKEKRILLKGKKQDVDTLAEQLEDLSKEIDKKIMYEKAKITEKMDLTKPQLDLLKFTGATENLMTRFKDLEVKIDKNNSIHFRGPDSVVKEGNISIWQYLSKMKDQEMELPRSVVSILTSDAGIVFLSKQFTDRNIEAVINSSDGNDDTRLIVTAVGRLDAKKAVDLIKEMTIEDSVPLDQDQKSLILSDKWKKLVDNFKTSMLLKVAIDPGSNSICIAGIKEKVNEAKEQVFNFLEENTIIDITVGAEAGRIKYLLRFKQDEVKTIEDEFKHHSLHILQDSNEEGFTIRGTKEGTNKASKKVLQLVNQIKDKSIEIEKPGIKKLFSDSKGKKLLSNIENDHTCIIEHWSPFDEKNMNNAGSATVAASQAQQVCSYVTPEGKNIILLKGDLTEFKVDVMVNAANSRLQHVGGLAKAIVLKGGKEIQDECDDFISRNPDLLDGEVFVSKPGKLPCKRLVHAVGPMWNGGLKKYRETERKEERILAQTVFNALEKAEIFTSIAFPAISSGIFGFPIDLCATTILESVLAYSKENARVKLTEIYIIDMNDNVIQAFCKEMRKRFGKDKTFTDGVTTAKKESVNVIARSIPRGKRRSVAKDDLPSLKTSPVSINDASTTGIKIDIIVGDLAKEEAHAIVNTVASDLDLSKNPCAKAISNAAGPQLQQECQGKGPLRVGDVVVTEGYNLGCKNVFHVCAGHWEKGKGEKVLRNLLVSCLKEANKRGFSSIAFPAIGTGNLGFPRDVVARTFFEEVNDFKKKHPQTSVLEVHFVLFYLDQPTIDAFQNEQKNRGKPSKGKRRSQPLEKLKKEDTPRNEVGYDFKNAFIGSVRVDLVPGDITKVSTDAIVTASNPSLDVAQGGGVGAAIAEAGGKSIQKECNKLGRQAAGSVVCTSAGKLPSKKLFHLVSASFRPDDMTDVILKCLKMAETEEISSIAIPAVGTGNASISPKEAAKALLKAVGKFCTTKPSSLQHIRIVVFQEHMLKDFHKAIEELEKTESSSGSSWGFFSWLKSLIYGGGDKKGALGPSHFDVGDFDGMAVSPHRPMCLKVFASRDSLLKEADKAINEVIREQSKRKVIDKPVSAIEGLSQTQEQRILRLQGKFCTEIEIEKRSVRIIINGLSEDVSDTAFAIYEILNEKTEAEHARRYAELVSKTVQWYYIEDGKREAYDHMINSKIETAFKENKDSVMVDLDDESNKVLTYKIVFATMKETNLDTRDETDVHREEQGTGIPLPHHWDSQPKDTKGKEKDLHLVQLDPAKNKQEYDIVLAAINKSSPINIVKIERVQNPELYRAYVLKKQKMDDKDGSNEKKLFHGTPVSICELVNHKGFNRSYCGKNALMYGKGVYFSRDASYSMRSTYSPPDPNGYRCMYLVSVLVGQFAVGIQNMIAPPPKNPNNLTITYDTTVDNINNPQLFVAYHDNQVYPEYLITFI